jgi:serine/threonine protein kinase
MFSFFIQRKLSFSSFVHLFFFLIFFRDIKGANILVDPCGDIKLADFGMAKHVS